MTSKHHRWQTRWRHDTAAGAWVHDCGLIVLCPPTGPPVATNGDQVAAELARTHGPHNAPAMLLRLLREAQQLHTQESPRHADR